MTEAEQLGLPPHAFDRQDAGDDLSFYAPARLVTHIDAGAVAALTGLYRTLLPDGAPARPDVELGQPLAGRACVRRRRARHELGRTRRQPAPLPLVRAGSQRRSVLPGADAHFDAVLVCVGVQYLQRPLAVFGEVRRVLRPGGVCIVSFSNRCFPTKAVTVWRALDINGHAALVRSYLTDAGFGDVAVEVLADGRSGDPLIGVTGVV